MAAAAVEQGHADADGDFELVRRIRKRDRGNRTAHLLGQSERAATTDMLHATPNSDPGITFRIDPLPVVRIGP